MRKRAEAELTLHIRSSELCSLPTAPLGADQFVAQLSSVGLGSASYVVGRRDPLAPEWIVLDYAAGGHERVWRQTRPHSGRRPHVCPRRRRFFERLRHHRVTQG